MTFLSLDFDIYLMVQSKIEKLKTKVEALESEKDSLKESEATLEAKASSSLFLGLGKVLSWFCCLCRYLS